jgi:hypothetical protein
MQPAIESAAHAISLDAIRQKRSPIFPCWYQPPPPDTDAAGKPLADIDPSKMLTGNILSKAAPGKPIGRNRPRPA